MREHPTRTLAETLIRAPSVTPDDAGCQKQIANRLTASGFQSSLLRFGEVDNLWAVRTGARPGPTLVLAGHTDVVPPGPRDRWTFDPFEPTEKDGLLYGRGAADMKTSLAAFVVAAEAFIQAHPDHAGRIALLLTSDEEGPAIDGTVKVLEALQTQGETLDYCIVGEPTSVNTLGDMIKIGRRGSLSGRLTVRGKQGHVAYPHLAMNPIHLSAPAIAALSTEVWDAGNDHFPPTGFQISNIQSGTGATNVIPGELTLDFNFRFSTASTEPGLKARVHQILDALGLNYTIDWTLGGQPYLTTAGGLCDALCESIQQVTGLQPELSTTGGTSDGRFIAAVCPQVVEFGPINRTIHQIDENIPVSTFDPLTQIYQGVMTRLLLENR